MHLLKNHQKHTSLLRQKLKKKGIWITEDSLDSNHHNDHNKDTTDYPLKTRAKITSKQLHRITKDNIERETKLEMELLPSGINYVNQWIIGYLNAKIKIFQRLHV